VTSIHIVSATRTRSTDAIERVDGGQVSSNALFDVVTVN
jgi:hypothetical protein